MSARQVSVSTYYIEVWKPLKSSHLCMSFLLKGGETDLCGLQKLSMCEAQD